MLLLLGHRAPIPQPPSDEPRLVDLGTHGPVVVVGLEDDDLRRMSEGDPAVLMLAELLPDLPRVPLLVVEREAQVEALQPAGCARLLLGDSDLAALQGGEVLRFMLANLVTGAPTPDNAAALLLGGLGVDVTLALLRVLDRTAFLSAVVAHGLLTPDTRITGSLPPEPPGEARGWSPIRALAGVFWAGMSLLADPHAAPSEPSLREQRAANALQRATERLAKVVELGRAGRRAAAAKVYREVFPWASDRAVERYLERVLGGGADGLA